MAEANRALALDRQNQRSHGLQANRAFVIESLLLLLFLAFGLALILRVFALADASGRAAHAKNTALFLASNAAEVFASDPLHEHETEYFDAQGNAVEQGSEEVAFEVSTQATSRSAQAGTFYDATVTVTPLSTSAGSEPYVLQTARYVSNARLAALEAYAQMQAEGLQVDPGQNAVSAEELAGAQDSSSESTDTSVNGQASANDEPIEEILEGPGA